MEGAGVTGVLGRELLSTLPAVRGLPASSGVIAEPAYWDGEYASVVPEDWSE